MIKNIKLNIKDFFCSFKAEKTADNKLPKYLELKFTLLPIVLIIICAYFFLDTRVENEVINMSPDVKHFFSKITDFGKADWMIRLAAIFLVIRLFIDPSVFKKATQTIINTMTRSVCFILSTIVIGGILGQFLKGFIGRARPKFFLEYGSTYFEHFQHFFGYNFASMPSGHSITLGSLFTCFIILFPKMKYLWVLLAVLFAASRVFVGSHYPSDVIFGLCFGSYVSLFIYYWMKNRNLI